MNVRALIFFPVFFLIILFTGCEREREIINGTISCKVSATTQYGKPVAALDNIEVSIYSKSEFVTSIPTDQSGRCQFEKIPYGTYNLQSRKDKYVYPYGGTNVVHIGGYCPTYIDLSISEVPTFELFFDSIGYVKSDYYLYLHIRPDTVYPQRSFRAFASNSSNVSKDNFISAAKGYLATWYPSYPTVVPPFGRIYIYDFDLNIGQLKNDTIYMRIYPLASNQGYGIMEFLPESVGKPSNVVKFLWNELIQ